MPANRAALSINLVPAVALLAGWFMLGETLTPVQLVGCATIIGAVILSETGPSAEEPVPGQAAAASAELLAETHGDAALEAE